MTGAGPDKSQTPGTSLESPMWTIICGFCRQGAGLETEHLELEPVPVCDASVAGCNLTCCATTGSLCNPVFSKGLRGKGGGVL